MLHLLIYIKCDVNRYSYINLFCTVSNNREDANEEDARDEYCSCISDDEDA
jgi:hypothetical protein